MSNGFSDNNDYKDSINNQVLPTGWYKLRQKSFTIIMTKIKIFLRRESDIQNWNLPNVSVDLWKYNINYKPILKKEKEGWQEKKKKELFLNVSKLLCRRKNFTAANAKTLTKYWK